MDEARLIQQASRVFGARLPPGWRHRFKPGGGRKEGPDALLEITGPDGTRTRVVVEAKSRLFPRAVADVKAQFERYSAEPGLVLTTFLTPSTRERLRALDLNYMDLTGNLRLILSCPGLYLETQGADDDPTPSDAPSRSLRGPKAGRLVRALADFSPPLSISDLAAKAVVDVSYASRLVEWLAREALVERRPRGPVLAVDLPGLIRRWADDYAVLTSNDARAYLDPRGLDNLVRRLADGSVRGRYAVTGSVAANRMAPVAPARLAMVYVDDPGAIASVLKLRPTEAGANVMLLAPFDDVVFERTWKDKALTLVAASQAAVDLLTSPGRAPSEAEALLEWMTRTKSA